MTSMLADVINAGTAWQARRVGFTLPAAGKTGTTNDYHDAWFVGYTPRIVSGVWVGYDQPRTIIGGGYAGDLAVPLWGRFMSAATKGDKPEWFRAPATVTTANICRLSGKLPNDECHGATVVAADGTASNRPMVYTEYFVRGSEPIDYCPFHSKGGFWNAFFGGGRSDDDAPTPPPAPTTGRADTVAAVVQQQPDTAQPPAAQAEPAARRRGFWSRFFRRGANQEEGDRREGESRKEEERRRQDEGR
jgi:membrane peptidoglycan carboxypeptidase